MISAKKNPNNPRRSPQIGEGSLNNNCGSVDGISAYADQQFWSDKVGGVKPTVHQLLAGLVGWYDYPQVRPRHRAILFLKLQALVRREKD